jgi:alpha-glucosidase
MTRFIFLALIGGVLTAAAETVSSPDGSLTADVSVAGTRLSYTVTQGSTTIVETSPLGFTLNGVDRGDNVTITSTATDDVDETFPSRQGMHATAKNRYHGKRYTVTHTPSGIVYVLNVRAYDSGIAFRYELTYSGAKNITAETSSFILPAGTNVWSQAGAGVYENPYGSGVIASIAAGTSMGPPVVAKLPGTTGYLALTESAPGPGFPNPYLTKASGGTGRQLQVTYPKNGDNTFGASTSGNAYTPWNVIVAGSSLDTLVNSDIVESLAPAPDPTLFPDGAATAWARPGRSVWDWMSRFPGGITAENSKLESYWASQLGWEYNTIDEGWASWNNNDPWGQVSDVTAYATSLGIKILLWTPSSNLATQPQRTDFFTKLKAAGASGFKADFFDFNSVTPAAKERLALMESILKEAAGYQLVADLHGTTKPVGQFRTYPNLLNIEAVYGKEQFPGAAAAIYPPLTRLLAGPADYTPLGLQGNLQGSQTQAFEIATVVNMAGPLITIAERGDRVAQSPFASVIKSIPNLWDETKVLSGSEVGSTCIMARRKGDTWYVAIMNANAARTLPVSLSFLNPGATYQAEIVRDGSTALEYQTVTNSTTLTAMTSAAGGFVAKFTLPTTASISTLPFITSFDPGRGSVYAENGQILSTVPWANTLLTDRLPDLMWALSSEGTPLTPALDFTDPFRGGASLKVSGTLDAVNDLPLYRVNVKVTEATKVGLAFKCGQASTDSALQVGLTFADALAAPVFLSAGQAATADWNKVGLDLSAYAGRTISEISLRFVSGTTVPGYSLKVGQLAIYEAPLPAPAAPADFHSEQIVVTGLNSVTGVLKWTASTGAPAYYSVYQRSPLNGSRIWLGATAGTSFALNAVETLGEEETMIFELAAVGVNGMASATKQTSVALPPRPSLTHPLSGAVIGTTGSFQGSGNTREKAYDGNVATFFDAANSDGVWAGIDLGAAGASKVTALRYYPRDSWSARMTGGLFQGANQSNFSDAVTLSTVASQPPEGQYTLVAISNAQTFRYLRYLSPNGGWGNVSEVQFYGPGKPAAPSGLKATRTSSTAKVSWQPVASAQSYRAKRSTVAGGPYVVVGDGLTVTSFTDTTLSEGTNYYYVVSAVASDTGEGPDSAEVTALDAYRQWLVEMGLIPGAAGTGFDEDADGDGIRNGLKYAVPSGLKVSPPAAPSIALSADLRDDDFLSMLLLKSADLLNWTAIPEDADADQDDVAAGFHRVAFHDQEDPLAGHQFYRLQVSR